MKTIILVAGVDYGFHGVNFRVLCDTRMNRRIAGNRDQQDLEFCTYDFRSGEIVVTTVTYGKGSPRRTVSTTKPYAAVTQRDYEKAEPDAYAKFRDGLTDKMSILRVYEHLRQIGNENPGQVVELSFFSHAHSGGPSLVNSFDDNMVTIVRGANVAPAQIPVPAGVRDPDDMDARAAKDFVAPTMDALLLEMFRSAFALECVIWIWGCLYIPEVHSILSAIERNPKYRTTGLSAQTVFTFSDMNNKDAELLERMLQQPAGRFSGRSRFEITFEHLQKVFAGYVKGSYAHNLAVAANRAVFGAVPGTDSNYDTGVGALMSINPQLRRHVAFYQNYFSMDVDPEGRGYGTYAPHG